MPHSFSLFRAAFRRMRKPASDFSFVPLSSLYFSTDSGIGSRCVERKLCSQSANGDR